MTPAEIEDRIAQVRAEINIDGYHASMRRARPHRPTHADQSARPKHPQLGEL